MRRSAPEQNSTTLPNREARSEGVPKRRAFFQFQPRGPVQGEYFGNDGRPSSQAKVAQLLRLELLQRIRAPKVSA